MSMMRVRLPKAWIKGGVIDVELKIAGVANDSIVDGPGFRFSIFVQGCTHACAGCQNPQTHDPDGGQTTSTDELIGQISANPLLKGVTFTGGEPFEQAEPLCEIADWCHANGLDVWSYSGYTFEQLRDGAAGEQAVALLGKSDVLVDGPFVEASKTMTLKWRGSSNQRVIDVVRSLEEGKVVEIV